MGLQCVAWSPCGQYIALGTHTHYLYLINRTNRKVQSACLADLVDIGYANI